MAVRIKNRRYRIKPRFYVIAALFCALMAVGILALLGAFKPSTVEWGRLTTDQAIVAVVVRDEMPIKADQYGRLVCLNAEGEDVAVGTPLAQLYLSGSSDKDTQNLILLQQRIKDYQENNILKDIVDQDLETLNTQINEKIEQISQRVRTGLTRDLLMYERDLRVLLDSRRTYMRQSVQADDYLNKLYEQQDTLEEKIAQTRLEIVSPRDGVVSYFLDGQEELLTLESIQQMQAGDLPALLSNLSAASAPQSTNGIVNTGQTVCRVVDASHWYAAFTLPTSGNILAPGAQCDITIEGVAHPVSATVLHTAPGGRNTLVVLAVEEGARDVMSLRTVGGHIGRSMEGLRVSTRALRQDDEGGYLVVVRGEDGRDREVAVNVLANDAYHAIIEEVENRNFIKDGLRVVLP